MKNKTIFGRGVAVLMLIATALLFITSSSAQQAIWTINNQRPEEIFKDKGVARESFPREFKLFDLNIDPLRQQLFTIVDSNPDQQSTVISLPNADGDLELFEVFEASNFEPDLQAQFPEIRAYSGRGITDTYAILKLSISPQGIPTIVFRTESDLLNTRQGTEVIEPYSADHVTYAVFRSHREAGELPWACATSEREAFSGLKSQIPASEVVASSAGQIKTMRLAQSCNAEYANFFGASTAGTLKVAG